MSRKLLVGLGGVVVVVLVGVFVVMPLLSPDDDVDDLGPVDRAASVGGTESTEEDESEETAEAEEHHDPEPDPVEETFEVFMPRDPFQQLVSTQTATPNGGVGNGTPGNGTPGNGTPGNGTPGNSDTDTIDGVNGGEDGDPNSDTDPNGEPPSSTEQVDGTEVTVVEVFTDDEGTPTVQVTVNNTGYEVTEDDDFATHFRVLDIDDPCATFLYGDQRFTLCEGESILK